MPDQINPVPDTDEIKLSRLAAAQQRFIRSWKPEGTHDIEEFERELYHLLHLAQQVAVAPILTHMTKLIATAPTLRYFQTYPETRK